MDYAILPLSDCYDLMEEYEELEKLECYINAESPAEAVEKLREILPEWEITPTSDKTALPLEVKAVNREWRAACCFLIDED